jgi:serine/threonine-protein kinase RsbW
MSPRSPAASLSVATGSAHVASPRAAWAPLARPTGMTTHLRLTARMPREATSVATVRRLFDGALVAIGVDDDCREDIVLALSEACSNAVEHARTATGYEVVVTVDRECCVAEVVDHGVGLVGMAVDVGRPDPTSLRGRGLQLIHALTDGLELRDVEPHGLAVRMTKPLTWSPDAPEVWRERHHDPWAVLPLRR